MAGYRSATVCDCPMQQPERLWFTAAFGGAECRRDVSKDEEEGFPGAADF